MNSLDCAGFVNMITAGHGWLQRHVDAVNALNVFPVPDGDTGTNMELSLAAGVRKVSSEADGTLSTAIQSLNKGLLMGARGNSGVILSQLFRGLLRVDHSAQHLTTAMLATALQDGVQIAYKAVSKPVEGTILTVARESAQVGLREAKATADLAVWMERVMTAANETLQRTPQLLSVLREAGVVDSGGQGLVYIYEGFHRYLIGKQSDVGAFSPAVGLPVRTEPRAYPQSSTTDACETELGFGYCTEFLVRLADATNEAEAAVRAAMAAHGDSLLVVQVEDLIKVHVHTQHPGRALESALAIGTLVQVKVENMTEQHLALDHPVAPVKAPSIAVVAVASGRGIQVALQSLGAHVVVDGGDTMNPSTEDIAAAITGIGADSIIVLPNHKNVIPSAMQAKAVVSATVEVVKTENIPQGIAALVAFHPAKPLAVNLAVMTEAIRSVAAGQVARAARETIYQGQEIRTGQFLGISGSELVYVGDSRTEAALRVGERLTSANAELLTLFYGANVEPTEVQALVSRLESVLDLSVEWRDGGQVVYDYIFSVE